jgi:hypothetical protein
MGLDLRLDHTAICGRCQVTPARQESKLEPVLSWGQAVLSDLGAALKSRSLLICGHYGPWATLACEKN